MNIHDIPLNLIDVPEDRARDFNADGATLLAASIAQQGLLHPIRLRAVGDRYALISGLHRLTAFKINQQEAIPADVVEEISDDAARLDEVMENIGRAELNALDRSHHLYELKQVWERMHPETKKGGDYGNQHTGGKTKQDKVAKRQNLPLANIKSEDMPIVFGFAKATAEKTGLSQRAIREAVMIWTRLAPAVRTRLAGSDLARKQTELLALSGLAPAMQVKVLDLILGDEHLISGVAEAVQFLTEGAVSDDLERKFLTVNSTFGKLADTVLDRLVAAHEQRIIASLKRQGRI